jgi:hypothetical protein
MSEEKAKKEEYKVKNILEVLKPIEAESTLDFYEQYIKIQFLLEDPFSIQLVLDRIHKLSKFKSKPLGYMHFSSYMQLLEIAKQFLVSACVMALVSQHNYEAGSTVISNTFNSAVDTIMPDSLFLIRHCLEEIWKKKEGMRK